MGPKNLLSLELIFTPTRSIDIFTCSPCTCACALAQQLSALCGPLDLQIIWLGGYIALPALANWHTSFSHDSVSSDFALLPVSPAPQLPPSRLFSHDFLHSDTHCQCEPRRTQDPFPQHHIRLPLAQRRVHMPLLHPSLNPAKTASHVRYTRIHHTRKRRGIRRRRTHLLGRVGPPSIVFPAGASRGPRGPLGAPLLP